MIEPKLRAALYARVSTEEQVNGSSLDEQIRLCTAEIERHGWSLDPDHKFIDAGISGTDATRPAWRKLLDAAKSGEVEVVVVLKLDRFARNAGAIITETDSFLNLGVRFVVVEQGIDMSTTAGKMMRTVLAGVAEMERDLIVGRTVAGQRALARQGKMPGGEPPYGWRRLRKSKGEGDGSVIPNEQEREVLRLGYELFVKRRMSCGQVVDWLNDAGIKPRWASHWNAETVRNIWSNPTLATGKLWWGTPKGQGGPRQRHSKTQLDPRGNPKYGAPIEVDLGDPVFTATEHRALLRAMVRRSTGSAPNTPKSRMLSGRIYTAEGHHMYSVNTPKEQWLGYYRCTKRRQSAGDERCQCPQLRALPIEQLVWAEVVRLLSDPARLETAARAYLALPEEGSDQEADQQALAGVSANVAKLERALSKSERGVLMADSAEDEKRQQALVADLKAELAAAHQRLAGYQALISSEVARGQALRDVAALAERARGRLHTMTEEERAEVVEILQISVVTSAPVTGGMPETVAISGVVDPRLWTPNAGSEESDSDATPAYSESQSQPGVAP